jgi:hypothetical protein
VVVLQTVEAVEAVAVLEHLLVAHKDLAAQELLVETTEQMETLTPLTLEVAVVVEHRL